MGSILSGLTRGAPNPYFFFSVQKFLKIQEDAKHLQKHSFKKFLKRVWAAPSVTSPHPVLPEDLVACDGCGGGGGKGCCEISCVIDPDVKVGGIEKPS